MEGNIGQQFSQLIHVDNNLYDPTCVRFNPKSLAEQPVQYESTGLSMKGLITETLNTTEVTPVSLDMDPLTVAAQHSQVSRFGIQPLPENVNLSMLPKPVDPHTINKPVQNEYLNGRKLNNWFTRLLEQKGQDYIASGRLSVDEVSRNAERILDDMISGKVDYNKQGSLIISPVIIETLINYCANKLSINRAIQYSLGYIYNDYTNRMMMSNDKERFAALSNIDNTLARNITQAIAIVNQDIGVYEILYMKLKYVNETKNASSLFSLTNELNRYRKQAKNRY